MSKKLQIPDYIVEKYGTDSVENIKDAKMGSDREDKQLFSNVSVEKALSGDVFKQALKSLGVTYRKELEERQAVFTISTEDADRDGDVILSNGIDTEDYKSNPVVLFAHDTRSLPIGFTLKLYKQSKSTKAVVMFFDDEIDNTGTSETIYRFVKAGGIKGASIGFRPLKARLPTDKEMDERKMGPYGILYEKISLLEWSVVTVPANQNALRSKGLNNSNIETLKSFGLVEDVEDEEDDVSLSDVLEKDNQNIEDEAIILIKALEKRVEELSLKLKDVEEKLADTVQKGSEQSDDSDFGDILSDIEKTIESFKN